MDNVPNKLAYVSGFEAEFHTKFSKTGTGSTVRAFQKSGLNSASSLQTYQWYARAAEYMFYFLTVR